MEAVSKEANLMEGMDFNAFKIPWTMYIDLPRQILELLRGRGLNDRVRLPA